MPSQPPPFETHVVDNQVPPFGGRDLWQDDLVLQQAVVREGAAALSAQSASAGSFRSTGTAAWVMVNGQLVPASAWWCR